METRQVKISVTTPDGELLDSITIDVPDGYRFVAVKAVNHSIGQTPTEEILTIGERNL